MVVEDVARGTVTFHVKGVNLMNAAGRSRQTRTASDDHLLAASAKRQGPLEPEQQLERAGQDEISSSPEQDFQLRPLAGLGVNLRRFTSQHCPVRLQSDPRRQSHMTPSLGASAAIPWSLRGA